MRFVERGPDIPDQLLEARDKGEVVFLCGAGASYPAGMPTFKGLTQHVLDELGAPEDAKSRQLFNKWLLPNADGNSAPSFDGIFNQIYSEYPHGEVDYCVAQKLKSNPEANLKAHECLLKLATGPDEKVRLVTTNFDLLFEKAASGNIETHIAPQLPDLGFEESFSGIVYLHGRLNYRIKRHEGRHGLVLSSSDFGRAYLSQGWATRFFRAILEKYTVVLVGYSASDPPVKYLLQGLRAADGTNTGRLYAFDSGEHHEVDAKWRDTGAIPISYVTSNREHSELWDSLKEWSIRAEDPGKWTADVLKLASQRPQDLNPIQRGKVVALVKTDLGAKLFAAMEPSAPADWLCVFDRGLRLAEKVFSYDGKEVFDPWENFHLDGDVRKDPDAANNTPIIGDDILSQDTGTSDRSVTRVAGLDFGRTIPAPARVIHLSNWIGKQVDTPVTAWWASKYPVLHPNLLHRFEWQLLRDNSVPNELGKKTWENLLDIFRARPIDDHDGSWFAFQRELKAFGWSQRIVKLFKDTTKPKLKASSQLGIEAIRPPTHVWDDYPNGVVRFEVKFVQRHGEDGSIPPEFLLPVYRAFRQNLELAANLLNQVDTKHWKTKSLYPDEEETDRYLNDADSYLLWFVDYLNLVCAAHAAYLIEDLNNWPQNDPYFFDKLRLYVWAKPDLFGPTETLDGIQQLTDESFWNPYHRRELLHMFRLRWSEFPEECRMALEERIAKGSPHLSADSEGQRVRAVTSATMLDWLHQNGCDLDEATHQKLIALRGADERYRPEWAADADDSHEGRSGMVVTKTDPSAIKDLPAASVIQAATALSGRHFEDFTELRPFAGLVEENPLKAITALNLSARVDEFPEEHWRTAIGSFPKDASLRLQFLFVGRLTKLSPETLLSLRHELFSFVENRFVPLIAENADRTFALLDQLLDVLLLYGPASTESSIGDVSVAGRTIKRSRRTMDHATNSPIGKVAGLLFAYLDSLKLGKAAGIPDCIKTRLERLYASPGEGSDYAVCVTTRRLRWLYYLDPNWIEKRVIPWFNLQHPAAEPTWNGYLYDNTLPEPNLFALIKDSFLEAAVHVHRWNWGDRLPTKIHEFLILACFRHGRQPAYITFAEARTVLQRTDDAGRSHSIWFLARLVKDKKRWRTRGKPFLDKAWPRESICQTSETSQRFMSLAEEATDNFDEIVYAILPFLVPIKRLDMHLYALKKDDSEKETSLPVTYPEATLDLLHRVVPSEAEFAPYDRQSLSGVLEMIGTAKPKLRQTEKWRRLNRIAIQA